MLVEFLVFLFFATLMVGSHYLGEWLEHHKHASVRKHLAWLFPLCCHPAVGETVRHYTIHLVVYSGAVFGH